MAGPAIVIIGTALLQAKLNQAASVAPKAFASAGLEQMEEIMAKAKSITPVDMGPLRDSGHVLPPEISGDQIEIVAGFGGAASDYAIVQHERLDFSHPSGQAKFLEQPFNEMRTQAVANIAATLKIHLERLGI